MAEDKPTTPITAEMMMQELNLDETDENNTVLTGLIQSAQEIILDSIGTNLSASDVATDKIYVRAVKALVTAMYYDRSLSQGVPLGVEMMITHLQGRYDSWPEE